MRVDPMVTRDPEVLNQAVASYRELAIKYAGTTLGPVYEKQRDLLEERLVEAQQW